jgi:hypothetical protein
MVLMLAATAADAQSQPQFGCGGSPPQPPPTITPTFATTAVDRTNLGFECMMWQNFIYLNWPVTRGDRGVPNKNAKFGAPGPTVWESYKTAGQTFLPDARNPGPWKDPMLMAVFGQNLAARIGSGEVRHLVMESKVSRAVLANVARHAGVNTPFLNNITQAGGGTLYDLNGRPVYYEVAMNRDEYEYIVQNGFYDANKQIAFAADKVIVLPSGTTSYGTMGALEVKAAWKLLSANEIKSRRFHALQALIPPLLQPVTVGLVGFHVFMPGFGGQGVWATFGQIDNAPVQGGSMQGSYNFYNPNCPVSQCPINVKNENPGQVVQITPDEASTPKLNAYMQALIKAYDPKTPWQYYKIINIQWPLQPVNIGSLQAPVNAPLPDGSPNSQTVVNPVLETFQQTPNTGCLACHVSATVAPSGNNAPNSATSYSFVFGHASVPKQ